MLEWIMGGVVAIAALLAAAFFSGKKSERKAILTDLVSQENAAQANVETIRKGTNERLLHIIEEPDNDRRTALLYEWAREGYE